MTNLFILRASEVIVPLTLFEIGEPVENSIVVARFIGLRIILDYDIQENRGSRKAGELGSC